MDNKEKNEMLKYLLDKHTAEFHNKRAKIHQTTERYLTLILVLFGWSSSGISSLCIELKLGFSFVTFFIMAAVFFMIYRDNGLSLEHAKIIARVGKELGLFDKNFLNSDSNPVYPDSWKRFGKERRLKGAILHFVVIGAMTVLLIVSVFMN